MLSSATALDPTNIEGVPPWLIWLGGAVLTPIVGVLVAYLRRLLRVEEPIEQTPPEIPPPPPGAAVTQPQVSTPTSEPDPEFALIREMVLEIREDLRQTRSKLAAAEERHRVSMADAEERHRVSMAAVTAKLADREWTIQRLEATIDTLTGRTPPPAGQVPPPPLGRGL